MLYRLYIKNIAVIEEAEIEFTNGLNILTGETGAGKSILINSILAVLGERTSRELIRTGAVSAFVSAEFRELGEQSLKSLALLGYEPEDGAVIIGREIKSDGKAVFRINSRPCTAAVLKEAGKQLINIHGQHDSQSLLDPARHITYIDSMLSDKKALDDYKESFASMLDMKTQLEKISLDESEKARLIDLLQYQIRDISSANIKIGEYDALIKKRDALRNYENIRDAISFAYSAIDGSDSADGALSVIKRSADELQGVGSFDDAVKANGERLISLCYELEDCAYELRDMLETMEFDPSELERVEERIERIRKISKKYGGEAEALEYMRKAKEKLDETVLSDERRATLELIYKKKLQETTTLAKKLSAERRKTALLLAKQVCEELEFLEMPSVSFEVSINEKSLSDDGIDEVEFLISANPGELPKPLAKIASGGELSRIMLAIKNVLADNDDIDTLIFDEVDSGVSGRAAQKIGIKLKENSRYRQIICVTHLAQIAAYASTHMLIEKEIRSGRTYTKVSPLGFEQRVTELARINSGENITQSMLNTCREMLVQAQR